VLRPLLESHLAAWLASLERAGLGDPRAYVADMLRDTDFVPALRDHTPDLLEEVDGLADGADKARPLMFALQLLDEEWAYRARRHQGPDKLEKCSSVAMVSPGGPTWIGQNMDLGAYTDGHQVLLRIAAADGTPAALVFSVAGMIGLMGVNSAAIGVCVNSIPQVPSAHEGVPVAFVLRRLLQATSFDQACSLVQSLPHATNQHYLIAGPGAVRSFEASAERVAEFHPASPDRVFHTNHPLSDLQGAPEPEHARENTVARLAALTSRLGQGDRGLVEIQAALSSFDDARHPVCRLRGDHGLINFTTGSMVSALRSPPADVQSWVSAGPPSPTGYGHVTLSPEPERPDGRLR
jgi:hypothetical protein